jgi:hypothetical protein
MNHDEFRIWMKHHATCFTAVGVHLMKFPETARSESEISRRDVLAAWEKVLANVALVEAIAATDALASGEESFSDKGFDCHPRDVRRIAMQSRGERHREKNADRLRRIIDGHETVACSLCNDEGVRFCVHPRSIEDFQRGRLRHKVHRPDGSMPLYTCSRACVCEAGRKFVPTMGVIRASDLERTWDAAEDWWPHVEAHAAKLATAEAF